MFSRRDASNTDRDRSTTDELLRTATTTVPTPVATPAPQPAVTTPVVTAQQSSSGSTEESLIAREDTFEGTLRTTKGVRVLGTVEGTIESDQYVHIEETAKVQADISADEVVIAGEYTGKLTCRARVEIRSTGRVSGQIDTVKLQLHEGGYFDGELHMQKPNGVSTPPVDTSTVAGDDSRPRRTRYVDISGEASKEVGAESGSGS